MSVSPYPIFTAVVIALALLSPSPAEARGIIIITSGERIELVGGISNTVKHDYGYPEVGYMYHYNGIFWIDLWTHSGTYCVYEGVRYNPITPAEAARLLKAGSESELSRPFWYKVPLGWSIIGVLTVVWLVWMAATSTGSRKRLPTSGTSGSHPGDYSVCRICGTPLSAEDRGRGFCPGCKKRSD